MAQFPSKTAKMLAVKRFTRGIKPVMETLQEGLEASLRIAFDYDAPKLIQAVLQHEHKREVSYELAEQIWNIINAQNKS